MLTTLTAEINQQTEKDTIKIRSGISDQIHLEIRNKRFVGLVVEKTVVVRRVVAQKKLVFIQTIVDKFF